MSTAIKKSALNIRTLTLLSPLVVLGAIGAHSAQYLPNTPSLFAVVFLARIILSLGVAFGIATLWTIGLKLKNGRKDKTKIKFGFWPVFACTSALVAVAMALASLSNKVSEGLLLLYL